MAISSTAMGQDPGTVRALRRTLLWVAALNFGYFFVEVAMALGIGSVSLFAESVDFLEDAAVSLLIYLALGWPLARRALLGKAMALFILVPALAAAWQAIDKFSHPVAPDPLILIVTAVGAVFVNSVAAWLLARHREHGGSIVLGAWLAARNDAIVSVAIIAMGLVTIVAGNGWPDLLLGVFIIVLNLGSAKVVWKVAEEEQLAARVLAGRDLT